MIRINIASPGRSVAFLQTAKPQLRSPGIVDLMKDNKFKRRKAYRLIFLSLA
jgi:hypothetical protein